MTNIHHGSYCRCAACIDAENRVVIASSVTRPAEPVAEVLAEGDTLRLNRRLPMGTKLYAQAALSHEAVRWMGDALEFVRCPSWSSQHYVAGKRILGQLAADPAVPPETTPAASARTNDLLEAARKSGLRSHLHGLNATDARKLLSDFLTVLAVSPPAAGAEGYPTLPDPEGTIHADGEWLAHERPYKGRFGKVWSEGHMRAYVDADRASRVAAPTGAQQAVATKPTDEAIMALWSECNTPTEENSHTTGPLSFARAVLALAAPAAAEAKQGDDFWLANRERVLGAIEAAGLQLLSNKHAFWLHPLASREEPLAPEAAPTAALIQISDLLSSMFSGARAHVRGEDEEVVGYTVRCGALHKIVGILASYKPVIIPATMPKAHETITGLLCGTSAASPAPEAEPAPFQARVKPWLLECFGEAIAGDREERNHRFLEEALELVQACGCTTSEAHQLVDYTFGRPVGEKAQEVGGVMVTLAALCLAQDIDMHGEGEYELGRISVPSMVAKIRAKQAAKPKNSPLPAARTTYRLEDGCCSICGGDWSVCGCEGMLRRAAVAASEPDDSPLETGEADAR